MSTSTLLDFEQFESLPSEPGKMELLDGELVRLPPAKRKHMRISHRVHQALTPLVAPAGLGEVYLEMGYKIGTRNWLQPDVSVEHAAQPSGDYSEGAPALAVEIISESNTAEQMETKVRIYLANGGLEVWLIYPRTPCVWLFRQGHAEEFRHILKSELLPGLALDLGVLFAD